MAKAEASGSAGYVRNFPEFSDGRDLETWLSGIYRYVEGEAIDAIGWYMRNARGKRWGSQWIRYSAIVLGGLAGVLPIAASVWPRNWWHLQIPSESLSLIPSLFIALAALLVALDRFADFSRGWMRYMLAAFEIRTALQEFRMDWGAEWVRRQHALDVHGAVSLLQLAKDFVLKVEQLVGDETRQWAAEFAQNLAQMEKEVTARSAERQREVEAQRAASTAGAIRLAVTNVKVTDDRTFHVVLESADGSEPVKETVTGVQTWVKSTLAPGMYTISATGIINQKKASASEVIQVKPAKISQVSLTLMGLG